MEEYRDLTREEMIRMAVETRKKVMNSAVDQQLFEKYPAEINEVMVPSREGLVRCYFSINSDNSKNGDILIINFHGGGFIRERTRNDELFCRKMNNLLGCKVLDVDYSIAPDHPYPTAVNEAFDVAVWAYENAEKLKINRDKIVLMGHSAGGNLAVTVTMNTIKNGSFRPLALIIDYPPLDISTDPADKKTMGEGIPSERARLYNLFYRKPEQAKEAFCSPVFASDDLLQGFPKTLILTAGTDDLCNEAENFGLRLAQLGNEVTLKRFRNARHGFTIYRTEGSEEAVDLICRFMNSVFEESYQQK